MATKTFENQSQRAKVSLKTSDGVLIEVPLVVIVRAIQEQIMAAREGGITFGGEEPDRPKKETAHWGFADFFADEPEAMVHLIVTTSRDVAIGGRQVVLKAKP